MTEFFFFLLSELFIRTVEDKSDWGASEYISTQNVKFTHHSLNERTGVVGSVLKLQVS